MMSVSVTDSILNLSGNLSRGSAEPSGGAESSLATARMTNSPLNLSRGGVTAKVKDPLAPSGSSANGTSAGSTDHPSGASRRSDPERGEAEALVRATPISLASVTPLGHTIHGGSTATSMAGATSTRLRYSPVARSTPMNSPSRSTRMATPSSSSAIPARTGAGSKGSAHNSASSGHRCIAPKRSLAR